MKKYYVNYYRNFGNTYNLISVEQSDAADLAAFEKLTANADYERITLKEAKALCKAERERAKYDPDFSGYADSTIVPAAEAYRLAKLYR